MRRAAALASIARAIDVGGDTSAALAALARVDPLIRGGARVAVRSARADAAASTDVRDEAHMLRIAYLILAGKPVDRGLTGDPAAVEAAFDAARVGRRDVPRMWWATTAVAIAIALSALGTAAFVRSRDARARPEVRLPPGPAPGGAYSTGGAPSAGAPAVRRAFAEDLPAFLLALDRFASLRRTGAAAEDVAAARAATDAAAARALAPDVRAGLGDVAARRLAALYAAARAASEAPEGAAEATAEALLAAAGALDDALTAVGLGYFVDGDVVADRSGRRMVIVYAFTVERVSVFESGDVNVRAIHVRRLDGLNWSHTLLGFTRPHLRDAVVLLDQLEEQVVTEIAPGLGKGASLSLFDGALGVDPAARAAVEAKAGEIVRAEYGALPGLDADAAAELGAGLVKRRALFDRLDARASARGAILRRPAKLRVDPGFREGLRALATRAEIEELGTIDEDLGAPAREAVNGLVRAALVASVERHEVQHRLDVSGPKRRMPAAMEKLVGPADEGGRSGGFASRARAELSAYLAELARDRRTPRSNLGSMARFLLDRKMHGTAESHAAVVIFEGLAADVAKGAAGPLVRDRKVDLDAASAVYLALAGLPSAELRAAAKRLWEDLFGLPLADLRRISPPEGP